MHAILEHLVSSVSLVQLGYPIITDDVLSHALRVAWMSFLVNIEAESEQQHLCFCSKAPNASPFRIIWIVPGSLHHAHAEAVHLLLVDPSEDLVDLDSLYLAQVAPKPAVEVWFRHLKSSLWNDANACEGC